jgi:hypothetical protein
MANTKSRKSEPSKLEGPETVWGNGTIDAYNIYEIKPNGKADLIAARFDLEDAWAFLRECAEHNPPPKIVLVPIYLTVPFTVELNQ